jgi:hypothetical protein
MGGGWMGCDRAAARLGVAVHRVKMLADEGVLTKRESTTYRFGRLYPRYEVKIEDVLRLQRTLELVGFPEMAGRLEAAKRMLLGEPGKGGMQQ